MKLVYIQEPTREVQIGDLVESFRGRKGVVKHFVEPHKPSSVGHISIGLAGTMPAYNYVGVWGMEWIEREDRTMNDICPCRDDAQPHIYEEDLCALCGKQEERS